MLSKYIIIEIVFFFQNLNNIILKPCQFNKLSKKYYLLFKITLSSFKNSHILMFFFFTDKYLSV